MCARAEHSRESRGNGAKQRRAAAVRETRGDLDVL